MAKMKKKTRNILSIILVALLTIGAGFGIYSIVSTKTKTISPTIFSVGGIGNDGNHTKNKLTLYNEDYIECQGLRIERDFESTVKYDIHYYDVVENYLGSVSCSEDNYVISEDYANARYCRIVIKPQNRTKDISFFETYSIAKQLKITVDKDQDYINKHNVFNYEYTNSGFTVTDNTLTFSKSITDFDSYYVKVADALTGKYDYIVLLSTYNLKSGGITSLYSTNDTIPSGAEAEGNPVEFTKSFETIDGYYAYVVSLNNINNNNNKADCYVVFNHLKSQLVPQVYLYSIVNVQQSS